ncbi:hypothetical protein DFJ67_1184 [Asanoa ferruginea]|uniref:Uncharacterized protein n=1 Tax=Asanoa ferruginea TaxID=53367 RepID=A0A3D9ZD25_9ACTN|nr:hypothetical protein [Asanoa ferruginea]REF95231.1 hypothetical protein DFJ67_1184 [Asanoa ferruginea]GIF53467.1 hypothetical protein Afe04nite_80060 [Asanoa ferruginea]
MDDPLLAGFLEALAAKVESEPDLAYYRIIQLKRPEALSSASPAYEAHFKSMVNLRDAGRTNVILETAEPRYPFKFILVDRRQRMLQRPSAGPSRLMRGARAARVRGVSGPRQAGPRW